MAVFAAARAIPDEVDTGSPRRIAKALRGLVVAAALAGPAFALGACQDSGMLGGVSARSLAPIPAKTLALMQTKGMSQTDPILIRAYKKEAEMEVWKRTGPNGQYALLKTFPICRWSGQLGPKTKQGDRQAPEGFYTIAPGQMNPNSSYYLSFDVGYPNAVDRAKGGTGNYIMVHGTCSSAGCFAMTDASMAEVYAIARESFAGGQRAFQFQSYPFRMTPANMARFRNDPNAPFWKNLKEGSDYFDALKDEPRVAACGTKYVFGGADVAAGSCTPRVDPLVAEKREHDSKQIAELVAKGERATRVVYEDGGQNPVFRPQPPSNMSTFAALADKDKDEPYSAAVYGRHVLGEVSRPESLAAGPQEIEIDAKGRPILVAAAPADAPGPTKAAAAALARKGKGGRDEAKPATVVAVQEAAPERKEAPPRITVADADGDPGAYHKLLGTLFSKPAAPAVPSVAPAPEAAPAKTETVAENGKESRKGATKRDAAKAEPVKTGTLKAESEKPSARMAARHAAKAETAEKPAHKPKPQASAEPAPGARGEAPRSRN